MTSRIGRRARLRSRATGEPYSTVLQAITRVRSSAPVIPVPTPDQSALEGHIFNSLGYLHYAVGYGNLRILKIAPEHDRLVVDVPPAAAEELGTALLPELEPGYNDFATDHGVGLRMRHHRQGVEFVIPGRPGSVVFAGTSVPEVLAAHHRVIDHSRGPCFASYFPDRTTSEEDRALDRLRPNELRTVSSLVRRLGLLRLLEPTSIDIWHRLGGGITAEVRVKHLPSHHSDRLIADLTSPGLQPCWIDVTRSFPEASAYSPPRHWFELQDKSCILELRLVVSAL